MKFLLLSLFALLVVGCTPNPYNEYYSKSGTLHPELLAKHRTECLALGFKDDSTELSQCRQQLAQDWKYNYSENRRDRYVRPSFGYGIGYGRNGGAIGVGSRF